MGFQDIKDLPDVFGTFLKSVEPLREKPRGVLSRPRSLPPLPDSDVIPRQQEPFEIPSSYDELEERLLMPLAGITAAVPEGTASAYPFQGGEDNAFERLGFLVKSGAISKYKEERDRLSGLGSSTKLSADHGSRVCDGPPNSPGTTQV